MIRYKHIQFTYNPEQSVVVFNENEEPIHYLYDDLRLFHLALKQWQSQSITIKMDDVEAIKVLEYEFESDLLTYSKYSDFHKAALKGILVNCIEIKCSSCNHVLGTELKKGCVTHCPDGDNYYKAVFKEPVGEKTYISTLNKCNCDIDKNVAIEVNKFLIKIQNYLKGGYSDELNKTQLKEVCDREFGETNTFVGESKEPMYFDDKINLLSNDELIKLIFLSNLN